MTIHPDELMDNAFVLTVNDVRVEQFLKRWDCYGLKRPRVFWGFHMDTREYKEVKLHIGSGEVNCSLSHYAMVKMAEALDLPFIFILEDDALPCYHIREKLKEALKDIPDDIDVLKLGGIPASNEIMTHKFDVAITAGAHAYIVFKRYYKRFEYIFNKIDCIADHRLINHNRDAHGSIPHIFSTQILLFIQKDLGTPTYNELHKNVFFQIIHAFKKRIGGDDFNYGPDIDITTANSADAGSPVFNGNTLT